jgi:hypothetical protein
MSDDQEFASLGVLARANRFARCSDLEAAIAVLETHLADDNERTSSRTSIRLYMRLAALYRFFKRHADEAQLLERFNRVHPDDYQRARVDARLSKVYACIAASRTTCPLPMQLSSRRPGRASPLERRLRQRRRSRGRDANRGVQAMETEGP